MSPCLFSIMKQMEPKTKERRRDIERKQDVSQSDHHLKTQISNPVCKIDSSFLWEIALLISLNGSITLSPHYHLSFCIPSYQKRENWKPQFLLLGIREHQTTTFTLCGQHHLASSHHLHRRRIKISDFVNFWLVVVFSLGCKIKHINLHLAYQMRFWTLLISLFQELFCFFYNSFISTQ